MARPSIRTDEIIIEVLERLTAGETMVSIFVDKHMPTKRAFNKWRLKDKELDQDVFGAMLHGYQVHADMAAETQLTIMQGEWKGDPKLTQAAVTAANNLGHQALAKLSKLDTRYKDKQEVHHTGPMVIGWDEPKVEEKADEADEDVKPIPDAITPENVAN